jgi:hypothetical protein
MLFNVKRVNAILLVLAFFSAPLAGCFGSEGDTLGLSIVDRSCEDLFLPPMAESYPFCEN